MKRLVAHALAIAIGACAGIAAAQLNGGVMESQRQGAAVITSGSINGTTIGATTPSTGAFTTLTATTVNGNTITTGTGVLTLGAGKTTTFDHTSTFTTTDAQTYTFPSTSATLARTDAANTFTGAQKVIAAATQDAVQLQGRAGGTSSFVATITPTTLTASRTITIPDAAITMARSDAAQTFTGVQTFTNGINLGNTNLATYTQSSFTVTLTGCGSATTGTALYSEVGNMIIIDYPTLTCTSNATTKTLTGQPGALGPATAKGGLMAIVQDNGAAFAVGLAAVGSGTGVVTLSKDVNGTAFTASGTFTMKATSLVYTAQ